MNISIRLLCLILAITLFVSVLAMAKPSSDEALQMLRDGNQRFVNGQSAHPNTNIERLRQAGSENQGDHAYATVITCSDSRVPVERLFDAGIMDIFVIRVAGNVCDVDEAGSIEYGIAHVNTPVFVVLGHTQCGAVTAVTHAVYGTGHALERNIPPLVDNIQPAVERAIANHPNIQGDAIIPYAIEENVWQGIEDLFMASPSTRDAVKNGKVKIVGAIYDVGTGTINWLPDYMTGQILSSVESNPLRAMNAMAGGGHEQTDAIAASHGGETGSHTTASTSHSGPGSKGSTKSTTSKYKTGHSNSKNTVMQTGATHEEKTSLFESWWFWLIVLGLFLVLIVYGLKRAEHGELKMNIGTKILSGFGIVLILMAVVIYIAESKMEEIGETISEINEIYIPLTEKLAEVEANAIKQELATNGYIIDQHEDQYITFEEKTEIIDEELAEIMEIIRGHVELESTGWESTVDEIAEQHDVFVGHATEILGRIRGGESFQELQDIYESVEAEGETLTEHIEELLFAVEDKLNGISKSAEATEKSGFQLILIIGLVAIVMGLSIGWLITKAISRPISIMASVAESISEGDINHTIEVKSKDEIGALGNAFERLISYMREMAQAAELIADNDLLINVEPKSEQDVLGSAFKKMTSNLNTMILQLRDNSTELVSAATEISSSSEQMAQGAKSQTDQAAQVSSAIEEMTATIIESSKNATEAKEASENAANTSGEGQTVVGETINGMVKIAQSAEESGQIINELATASDRIGEIISVIDDIADQTNLLALNAAIEAARAGEQGRGFAVVADEVRKLAERTGKATGEITDMIKGIQADSGRAVTSMEEAGKLVEEGKGLADKAGNSLDAINSISQQVTDMIVQIATAADEQSSAAEQISKNMEMISNVSKESAAGAEQSASAAEQLNRQAESMQQMVSQFKVKEKM